MDRFSYSAHRTMKVTADDRRAQAVRDAQTQRALEQVRATLARQRSERRQRLGLVAGLAILDLVLVANVVRVAAGVMA